MAHDQLQRTAFLWCWNNYPELRYLFWMNLNNVPGLSGQSLKIALSRLKAMGLVQGVADMSFIDLNGRFHAIEFKVGLDTQSKAQKAYEIALNHVGATYTIVSSLEAFKTEFSRIYGCEIKND